MIEIARIFTFGTSNNREIVLRLMRNCKSFQHLTFADALAQYRYCERNGLVDKHDGYLVVYHRP